jgi:hypothetical protein
MANSKLLKEAIADAKAVKETALANAKLALEEAFTPRLQSILSQKMRAEAEMEDDADQVDEELDSSNIGSKVGVDAAVNPGAQPTLDADTDLSVGVTKDGGKPEQAGTDYTKVADINEEDEMGYGDDEKDQEIAELKARLAELESGGEDWADSAEPENEDEDPFAAMQGDDQSYGQEDEEENPYAQDGEDDSEDNMDLESIIRELEAQLNGEEGDDHAEPDADNAGGPSDYDSDNSDKIAELKRQLAELEGDDEEEEAPKTESKKLRESRRRLKEDYTDGAEAGTDPDGEKVIDLEEILREMEDDLKGDSAEDDDAEDLKADLNEAYKTIKSLQSTINEVNLLNAKLLFANKLFRAHNMTNEQKVKVIETLDRTKSVREVKLVYSTLAENFKYTSTNKIAKKSIAEGIASKVVKSTKPAVAQKQVISESATISNRFKKLAGIIK